MTLGDLGFIDTERNEIEWLDGQPENGWPEPRWRHASSIIAPYSIFIGGGCGRQNNLLNDCWVMRVRPQSETKTPSVKWESFLSLPSGRHSAVASLWKDLIVISGGLNKSEMACQPQLLVSNTNCSQEWKEPVWSGPSPIPRYSHQALVTTDNRMFLVGGISTCHPSSPGVCIIDLQRWTSFEYSLPVRIDQLFPHTFGNTNCTHCILILSLKIQDIARPVILASFNAQLIEENENTKIICWGGGSPCFSFGTHLNGVHVELEL